MARSFVSASSQGLQSPSLTLSSFNKLSVSFWLNWTAFANDDKLACELTSNTNTQAGGFFIDPDSSVNAGLVQLTANLTQQAVTTFSRPSAGVWHHWLVLLDYTQSADANIFPAAYIDGVSQSLGNNGGSARTPQSFPNTNFNIMCRNQASLFADGSIADVALWFGTLLTSGNATSLANGVRPASVSGGPTYWWPLDGYASPETDLGGNGANATLTGSPVRVLGPPALWRVSQGA